MSEYTRSHLALWSQLDLLGAIGFAVAALALFALARQYYLFFATPPAILVRPWVPMPDDLPEGPVDPYGARALKATYQPNLFGGVNGSVTLHITLIASGLLLARMMAPVIVEPDHKYRDTLRVIPIPPSIQETPPLHQAQSWEVEPVGPPKLQSGIAIPVPDHTVSLDKTILEQGLLPELDVFGVEDGWDLWGGKRGRPDGDPNVPAYLGGDDPDAPVSPDIVERLPELVTIPDPVYPALARESGTEGVVRVNVLVGRDGRVRDAKIVQSIPMLDEPAQASARAAIFRPALWNGNPVSVWVTIPIRFSLRDR
jgi:TonB family protein